MTDVMMDSVAPEVANMKRGLRMSWFAEKKDHLMVGLKFEETKDIAKSQMILGQVAGVIYKVEEREFATKDPNGGPDVVAKSLVALGDFEAVRYSTGEVASVGSAALPRYFLEGIAAALEANALAKPEVVFAIEVFLVPTGKHVPTAYEVKNLIPRAADSPLNRVKAALAKAGRLKLSPPSAPEVMIDVIDGEVIQPAAQLEGGSTAVQEGAEAASTAEGGKASGGKAKSAA